MEGKKVLTVVNKILRQLIFYDIMSIMYNKYIGRYIIVYCIVCKYKVYMDTVYILVFNNWSSFSILNDIFHKSVSIYPCILYILFNTLWKEKIVKTYTLHTKEVRHREAISQFWLPFRRSIEMITKLKIHFMVRRWDIEKQCHNSNYLIEEAFRWLLSWR